MTTFTESVVEGAALAWLEGLGWTVKHGPDIAPEAPSAERSDYGRGVLERLGDSLARLNPALPAEALVDAFRKLTRPLAVLELKNTADKNATLWSAFQQIQTYRAEITSLFATNVLLVISGVEARAGTLTAGREWFKSWRTIAGERLADPHLPKLLVVYRPFGSGMQFVNGDTFVGRITPCLENSHHRHSQIFLGGAIMRLEYDPKYNVAYIRFLEGRAEDLQTLSISAELNIDMTPDGHLYGIELLNANEQLLRQDAGQLVIEDMNSGRVETVRLVEHA